MPTIITIFYYVIEFFGNSFQIYTCLLVFHPNAVSASFLFFAEMKQLSKVFGQKYRKEDAVNNIYKYFPIFHN